LGDVRSGEVEVASIAVTVDRGLLAGGGSQLNRLQRVERFFFSHKI